MSDAHWPDETERARRAGHVTTPPLHIPGCAGFHERHQPCITERQPDEAERARRRAVERDAGRPLDESELTRRTARLRELSAARGRSTADPGPVPLSPAWRLEHVEHGDDALARALRLAESGDHGPADTWARIATAHYAAANVRAKPAPAGGVVTGTSGVSLGSFVLGERESLSTPGEQEALRRRQERIDGRGAL